MTIYRLCVITSVLTALAAIYAIFGVAIDQQLPVHWGVSGQADRFTDATTALIIPPIVMFAMLALILVLKFIEPRKEHIEQSKQAIDSIIAAVVLLMFIMELGYFGLLAGWAVPMNLLVIFALGLMFIIMGNFLGKVRSNFFIGIRTPWTLSSDHVWIKTHRLAGPLFMLAGLLTSVLCWLIPESAIAYLVLATITPAALIPTIYSWWLFNGEKKGASS